MIQQRKWKVLLVVAFGVVLALAALTTFGKAVPAKDLATADIVAQFGNQGSVIREIQFTAPISGLAALEESGLDVVTKDFGGGWIAVCAIEGVGCPADDCFCDPDGKYWGNSYWDGSAWQAYSVGASQTELNDGAIDGWYWGVWGDTPANPAAALAAESAMEWIRTQQVITDGSFGSESVTLDVLLALGANHEDPATWSTAPSAPSLASYFLVNGHAIAAKNAGKAGKMSMGTAATGLCYPFHGKTPMSYYDEQTGLFDSLPPNQAMGILGTVALSETVPVTAVQALKAMQNSDGGWAWSSGFSSDSNTTALGIQALVAAGEPVTSTYVVSGLHYLKSAQNDDGGFAYDPESAWSTASDTNSTAYAINAIYAVGEDPLTGTWVISGTNPVNFLLSMQLSNGAFEWQKGFGANLLATAQAVPALLGQSLPLVEMDVPQCPPRNFFPLILKDQ